MLVRLEAYFQFPLSEAVRNGIILCALRVLLFNLTRHANPPMTAAAVGVLSHAGVQM